ncbi:reverse transcriptase domain-containing protein [Tanacetum coccineum]|uniref:Reverse transcriptase domain-containing protein n=1 Tax=Tanacetum coccineum TaxID=301880 RepID=A0ABQ5DAC8_9ASTR
MREVYYHDWLSNPVMVKKHDGSWRMCVDFTDLNKACPQDCYPLSEIDWKIESLCGYPFKCFLDAYKGYHQIQMAESDEEKTAFHTSQGVYCYTKMPFGLKNASATYQRLVDKAFDIQLPLLVAPKPKEELIIYLSASYGALSAVLMTERGTIQTLVYFISRALQGLELNYTPMEKLVLSLVFAAKRLQRKVAKMKRHAGRTQYHIPSKDVGKRTDIGRLPHGSGAGLILTNPEGAEFTYALRFQFTASNNEAEYEALIAGLWIATQMGVRNIQVLIEKSIQEKEVTTVVEEEGTTWMTPIVEYLKDGTLLGDRKEASKLRIKARQYELREGILYRRSLLKLTAVSSSKGYAAGILLAGHAPGRKRYDRVRGVAFRPGDFVYRSNDASHAAAGGKLRPKWEGPYEVTETLGDGAYKLRTMDGADLPRTWNVANLKKCYL